MTDSIVLDVIIGLFVVYFIASSLASVVSEAIGMLLNRRANNMAAFVLEIFTPTADSSPDSLQLLVDPAAATANANTANAAATSAQAAAVAQPTNKALETAAANANREASIAAFTAVKATVVTKPSTTAAINDAIQNPGSADAKAKANKATADDHATKFYQSTIFRNVEIGGFLGGLAKVGRWFGIKEAVPGSAEILSVSKDNFGQAVFEVLTAGMNAHDRVNATLDDLKNVIEAMPESPIKAALVNAIQQADTSAQAVVTNMGKWFDGQMAQLSDYYKRRTRLILFVIGLGLAVVLNLDSILIYNTLQNNPSLRQLLVAHAQGMTESNDPAVDGSAFGTPPPELLAGQGDGVDIRAQVIALNQRLNSLGLPIGFGTLDDKPDGVSWEEYNFYKALGILFTTVAITLGAQFWFDLLKVLTSRGSSR